MDIYISLKSGGHRGRSWRLVDGSYTVGRDRDCDVVLPDRSVSRAHCRIAVDATAVTLTDLGSANGSWVNGTKLDIGALNPGDELRLGSISLHLSAEVPSPSAPNEATLDESLSLADTESVLLRDDQLSQSLGDQPETILDLANVCSMGRELSRAKGRPELIKALVKRLRRHLGPGAIHLLSIGPDSSFADEALYAARGRPVLYSSVREQMAARVALDHDNRRALAEIHRFADRPVSLLAAPTVLGNPASPILVVELDSMPKRAVDRVLDYLLAVGITLGPFLHTLESAEALLDENKRLASAGVGKVSFIGESPGIVSLLKEVRQIANTPLSVLITGETGVGKELVAALLHDASERRARNLVVVNSPAISHELFASQLFGHRRGAFTGAHNDHKGFAKLADGGTLFFDEVADLSPENQASLLRFVETNTFFPVGSDVSQSVDVRIIAATNGRLPQLVAEGKFRPDLYHRLAAIHISIPALRERPEDIPALAYFFLSGSLRFVKRPIRGITDQAMRHLTARPWPGNARELKNTIERAAALTEGEWITEREVLDRFESPFDGQGSFKSMIEDAPTLDEFQRRYITHVFNSCAGNGVKAGKVLGLPKSTVYDKLRKYGLLGARDPEE